MNHYVSSFFVIPICYAPPTRSSSTMLAVKVSSRAVLVALVESQSKAPLFIFPALSQSLPYGYSLYQELSLRSGVHNG